MDNIVNYFLIFISILFVLNILHDYICISLYCCYTLNLGFVGFRFFTLISSLYLLMIVIMISLIHCNLHSIQCFHYFMSDGNCLSMHIHLLPRL